MFLLALDEKELQYCRVKSEPSCSSAAENGVNKSSEKTSSKPHSSGSRKSGDQEERGVKKSSG